MKKYMTAGAFVFSRAAGGWRLGMIEHPRLHRFVAPGGHVEVYESVMQAALREVWEETGLQGVQLLEPPGAPYPAEFPSTHPRVSIPWWISEGHVAGDNTLAEPHIHVDNQYVATVDDPTPAR